MPRESAATSRCRGGVLSPGVTGTHTIHSDGRAGVFLRARPRRRVRPRTGMVLRHAGFGFEAAAAPACDARSAGRRLRVTRRSGARYCSGRGPRSRRGTSCFSPGVSHSAPRHEPRTRIPAPERRGRPLSAHARHANRAQKRRGRAAPSPGRGEGPLPETKRRRQRSDLAGWASKGRRGWRCGRCTPLWGTPAAHAV